MIWNQANELQWKEIGNQPTQLPHAQADMQVCSAEEVCSATAVCLAPDFGHQTRIRKTRFATPVKWADGSTESAQMQAAFTITASGTEIVVH